MYCKNHNGVTKLHNCYFCVENKTCKEFLDHAPASVEVDGKVQSLTIEEIREIMEDTYN